MDWITLFFIIIPWLIGLALFKSIPILKESPLRKERSPGLSIIIPARNEEKNLPQLLESIKRQSILPNEVIVMDDDSHDRTSEIAQSFDALVYKSKPLPNGWTGKTWACFQGAKKATQPLLLFLDADTVLDHYGLEKLLSQFQPQREVISIQPYHHTIRPYEELSAFFNMVLTGATLPSPFTSRKDYCPTLFGPSLLIHREDYFDIGGHEIVKDKILENLFLTKSISNKGFIAKGYSGFKTLSFRMYPNGIKELISGWSKAFAYGGTKTNPLRMVSIIVWISGAMTAFQVLLRNLIQNPTALNGIEWLSYTLFVGQIYWILRRIGNFKFTTALIYPIPLLFFFLVYFNSLFKVFFSKKADWKERTLVQ